MPLRPRAAPIGSLLLLAFAAMFAFAAPAAAAAFTDAAGRRVILPDRIGRVLPAERDAEVLVYVLAPDKLAGLEQLPGGTARVPGRGRLPLLRFQPHATPDSVAAAARDYRADLIIDAGPVTPERAAFADAVQLLTGIPYIMVDDSFDRTPTVLRSLGTVLGVPERGDELRLFAENSITGMRGRLLIRSAGTRPLVYYGRGPDGLTTALPGSPEGAAIDEAGAINVASPLGRGTQVRISREQLVAWDPEFIIAEERSFYNALRRDSAWRRLSAVRNKKVYLEPGMPFGWLDDPTGVNRLISLYWLSTLFYPDATQEELRGVSCEFYDRFYRLRLTNAQVEAMVGPAGAPPRQAPRLLGEAPVGLGGRPPPLPSSEPPLPTMADQRDAPCTIPGIAAPLTGIITGPGTFPEVPPARPRQPGAPPPGLPGSRLQ